ncbi:hypothetical protein GLOTRDRAFT_31785, partial [Gloeophyllum trabeum ATCC 11539]
PPGCIQIPALDAHFFSSVRHHASTLSSLNRGDAIEIQGSAGSGKSHLLYHLLITCLIPILHSGVELGGWGKAAILFDADDTFDILRLRQLMVSRIARTLTGQASTAPPLSDTTVRSAEEVADPCLHNLHIFKPTSSLQLAASILHLPAYHAKHMQDSEIGLVVIDSLSAFYWLDRYSAEQARTSARSSTRPSASPLSYVLLALQHLRLSHGPVIAYSNWGLQPVSTTQSYGQNQGVSLYKQHLHPLQSPFLDPSNDTFGPSSGTTTPTLPLTHHITLPFVPIPPFPPDISLADARDQEEKYRRQIIDKGEIMAIARTVGSPLSSKFIFTISKETDPASERPGA